MIYFQHLGKAAKNIGKKTLNDPGRAIKKAAIIGTETASKCPKLIAATALDFIEVVHRIKGLCLGKIQ